MLKALKFDFYKLFKSKTLRFCLYFTLGMKQRLGIALALAGGPDILVLDEPINGLAPEWISLVRSLIQKIHDGLAKRQRAFA